MEAKKIKITCKGSKSVPLEDLAEFQGNLKTLSEKSFEKLKRAILKHGFSFPVFVWRNYIIDGHQRLSVIKVLIDEGYSIDKIPVVEIQAKNKKEAGEKLLLLNSQYAKMTEEGLYNFLDDCGIDFSELHVDLELPTINTEQFMASWLGEDTGNGATEKLKDFEYQIIVFCKGEAHQTELLEQFKKEGLKCRPLIL